MISKKSQEINTCSVQKGITEHVANSLCKVRVKQTYSQAMVLHL